MFKTKDAAGIIAGLKGLDPALRRKIVAHHKKYLWIHYTYEGPVLEFDYFIEIWRGLVKENSLEKLIRENEERFQKIKIERGRLVKKLNFTSEERAIFEVARDIVWLKGWRKDCMYFGTYVLDKIAKEIGRRLGLSLKQVRYFCDWEIEDALLKNKFNPNELNERAKFSLIISNSKKVKIYSGEKARKILPKLNFEKEKIEKVDQLSGTCACPGKARGMVKIVETVDDMEKMNKRDILLSETTYPALVPAMKLAAAIVTNAGGLTCHAAIVSRELGIPCVVGTKIATKVLKDGDMVEVDATKGIVKRLK